MLPPSSIINAHQMASLDCHSPGGGIYALFHAQNAFSKKIATENLFWIPASHNLTKKNEITSLRPGFYLVFPQCCNEQPYNKCLVLFSPLLPKLEKNQGKNEKKHTISVFHMAVSAGRHSGLDWAIVDGTDRETCSSGLRLERNTLGGSCVFFSGSAACAAASACQIKIKTTNQNLSLSQTKQTFGPAFAPFNRFSSEQQKENLSKKTNFGRAWHSICPL